MAEIRPQGGTALRPVERPPDGTLRVRGGVGGIRFQFEELLAGANALDGAVRQLAAIAAEADAVRHALFPSQMEAYDSGSRAIIAVGESGDAVGRVCDSIGQTRDQVRASYREYEYTEAMNAIRLRTGFLYPVLQEGFGLFSGGSGSHRGDVDRAEHLVAQVPLIVGTLLGSVIGVPLLGQLAGALAGKTDVRAILKTVAGLPGLEFLKPRAVTAEKLETSTEPVDTSPAGLLRRTGELHGAGQGEIAVIKVEGTGSKPAWVVLIPGTQPGHPPGGSNPIDEGGIVDALGYDSAHLAPAIMAALREAGADAGDMVVAVGHSQGGAHVMNLAANKAFLATYDLKYVLTAGSPVGGITPAPGISSLHLEHSQDWVPGTDGVPNPDTRDRVTVTLENPVRTPDGESPGLGPGHRLESYAEGAELIEASRDPSLLASTAVLAGVIGKGKATAVTRFKLTREPMLERPRPSQPPEQDRPRIPENRSLAGPR